MRCLAGSCIAGLSILVLLPAASKVEGTPLFRTMVVFGLLVFPIFVSTKIAYRSGVESVKRRESSTKNAPLDQAPTD